MSVVNLLKTGITFLVNKKIILLTALTLVLLVWCGNKVRLMETQPYFIMSETYSYGEINIKYPQICGMQDATQEKKINDLIISDLLENQVNSAQIYDDGVAKDILALNLNFQITMQTPELLSVLYLGDSTLYSGRPDARSYSYHTEEMYGITIELTMATKLQLANFAVIDTRLVHKIKQSNNITNSILEDGLTDFETLHNIMQDKTDIQILNELSADIYGGYSVFCVTTDSLLIGISICHACGDYALVEIFDYE